MAKMGRPRKFKNPEELKKKIDDFFKITPEDEQTITGLALHLGTFRNVLMDYEKGKYNETFEERLDFSNAIKEGKDRIANGYEKRCIKRGNAGDIFALKNFGWTDRHEIDANIKGSIAIEKLFDDIDKNDE